MTAPETAHRTRIVLPAALTLTVLTGFSGLVYEVAWQKYLATLLGSHAEATAAVLGIFLGGLSAGYALFGRLTRRLVERARTRGEPPRLLYTYALVEASIGLYALLFPWIFDLAEKLSLLGPSGAGTGFAFDIGLSALLSAITVGQSRELPISCPPTFPVDTCSCWSSRRELQTEPD